MEAPIIIAGAGPVGTCLAIDAAMRGVKCIIIEPRDATDPPDAKCNTIAARTMETFRRFGVADEVRAAGLPDDYPSDTIYTTSITGPELTRITMPSRNERASPGFLDSDWPTPEPMVRESQLYLEPILRKKMLSLDAVTFLPRTEVTGFTQSADGVTVHCRNIDEDRSFDVKGAYLVGCDGGTSPVRKAMGAKLSGDAEIARTRTTLIRSKGIKALFGDRRPAWMSWVINHKARGNVIAINGDDLWLVHRGLWGGNKDFDSVDFDQSIRDVLGVGPDFEFEVLRHEDWVGRRLVAEKFRNNRVFIAGDAAHLWVPYAGYGMNAGIADAMNLSWVLSAAINGWADPAIIDAFEAERLPITDQVSRFAMGKLEENSAATGTKSIPALLSQRGIFGGLMRKKLGKKLYAINAPQMSPEGLNFGYYYTASPIIVEDGERAPDYDMGQFTPSTVPGCRLPHFYVDGTSILDLLGPEYTLIRFDTSVSVEQITQTGLPLAVVDAVMPNQPAFRHKLLIVRADTHIAWRGDAFPEDVAALADRLRGKVLA